MNDNKNTRHGKSEHGPRSGKSASFVFASLRAGGVLLNGGRPIVFDPQNEQPDPRRARDVIDPA